MYSNIFRKWFTRSLIAFCLLGSSTLHAEANEVRLARQYGLAYLPLIVMQEQGLIEKHANNMGLGPIKVTWNQFSGGSVMNDALLSGGLDIAVGGPPPFLTLWSKTRNNLKIMGLASVNAMPMYLITRNPKVNSIEDFTGQDRIVVSGVKVSTQAVVLQMAAAQAFGMARYGALDHLTVAMPLADSMAIMLSGQGQVTADFTVPPFPYRELKQPGLRSILDTDRMLGGPSSTNLLYTTARFRENNPKLTRAILAALEEAQAYISHHKTEAAEMYLRVTRDKDSVEDIVSMLSDPRIHYGLAPQGIMKFAEFMHKTGSIKTKPASWKEVFLDDIHTQPGN